MKHEGLGPYWRFILNKSKDCYKAGSRDKKKMSKKIAKITQSLLAINL
jgi:hypothetical protein